MLEALSAPYKHTGVRFMSTGGVGPANLESYLSSTPWLPWAAPGWRKKKTSPSRGGETFARALPVAWSWLPRSVEPQGVLREPAWRKILDDG